MVKSAPAPQMMMFDIPTAQAEEFEREMRRVMFAAPTTSSKAVLPRDRVRCRESLVLVLQDAFSRRSRRDRTCRGVVKLLGRLPDPVSRQDLDQQVDVLEDLSVLFPEDATVALASLCPA